jgi:hypothetical protein
MDGSPPGGTPATTRRSLYAHMTVPFGPVAWIAPMVTGFAH